MYYAERDASKFEAAAEAMYAHIADPTQPEWQEVKAMGEDLVPHNPLFGGNDDIAGYMHDHVTPVEHVDGPHLSDDNFDLGGFDADGTPASEESFDFDLADHSAKSTPVVEPAHFTPPVVAPDTLRPGQQTPPTISSRAKTPSAPSSISHAPTSTWVIRKARAACSTK